MDLYKLNKSKLEEVRNIPFKLEKDIQSLVEDNLEVLFGLEFVKTEFQLNNFRIDTLGFDQQTKSFVIIEYKKGHSYSVIDQGYSYLSLLLNNKADFILEYQECTNRSLKKGDVDWSQSKVIFVSPQFTTFQKQSIEFKDLPFDLWEIKKYSNDTVILNQHKPTSQESVKTISSKDERAEQVSKEIVVYTEEDHYQKGNPEIRELATTFRDRILELDNIEINPVKQYIGFKLTKRIVTDFEVQKNKLKLRINLKNGTLDDPKNLFRDVSNIGTFGVGDYEAVVTPDSDLDYLMSLIKQSYKFHNS
ncbi:MAG: putative transport protein [Cyclobacteriaceae bacterium]|jgi:predicted transport protein